MTRSEAGLHAVQMELACRRYMEDASIAARMHAGLRQILYACRTWAEPSPR
jgi:N-formylglutamate amidohydrolase